MISDKKIEVNTSLGISSVVFLERYAYVVLLSLKNVFIADFDGNVVKTIQRLALPRKCISAPCGNYFMIIYSDHYHIVYDGSLEPIEILMGVPMNPRAIKFNFSSTHLVYGNDTSMFVWNLKTCDIQSMGTKWKEISSMAISEKANKVYLGKFTGDIIIIQREEISERNIWNHFQTTIKVHGKCVMELEAIDDDSILSVCYNLEFVITNSKNGHKQRVFTLPHQGGYNILDSSIYLSNRIALVKIGTDLWAFNVSDKKENYLKMKKTDIPANYSVSFSGSTLFTFMHKQNVLLWKQNRLTQFLFKRE